MPASEILALLWLGAWQTFVAVIISVAIIAAVALAVYGLFAVDEWLSKRAKVKDYILLAMFATVAAAGVLTPLIRALTR